MSTNKGKSIFTAIALNTALLALSSVATAGTVILKPGAQNTFAPEFGSALARSGSYTAVGAAQETIAIPGEAIFGGGTIAAQGAVRLFNGTNAVAERTYQFPGNNHFFKRTGAKVAISDKWLAFAAMDHDPRFAYPTAIYIVGKTNNQWLECPTVNTVIDCSSLVGDNGVLPAQPIVRIPFSQRLEIKDISVAISDDYLVIGDNKNSKVTIYRHDASLNRWVEEMAVTDLIERRVGSSVAIDGDKVAVSAPYFKDSTDTVPGLENGSVRIYKRNTNGTWYVSGSAYGYFTDGNFGRVLDMHSGNLVVSSGRYNSQQHLTFFRVDSSGSLSSPYYITSPTPNDRVAVHGDTAIITTQTVAKSIAIYKRNTANNTWNEVSALDGDLYKNTNSTGLGFPGIDDIDIVGDDLSLGWRAYNNLVGGFIHEKASLIDTCKSPLNLVANCAFDNTSGTGWQFLNHMGASAAVNYTGSQLNAVIYYGSSVHWHIQARTAVNLATSGTYKLRFRAKADNYRSLTVNLGHNGNQDNNWVSYGQTTFTPGPEWNEFTFEFNGVPADANAFLDFNLGNAGTTGVSIDGVKLTKQN